MINQGRGVVSYSGSFGYQRHIHVLRYLFIIIIFIGLYVKVLSTRTLCPLLFSCSGGFLKFSPKTSRFPFGCQWTQPIKTFQDLALLKRLIDQKCIDQRHLHEI